jgi:hypothetical protein
VIRRHQDAEATLGEELCRGEAGDAPREEGGYKREIGAYTIPAV